MNILYLALTYVIGLIIIRLLVLFVKRREEKKFESEMKEWDAISIESDEWMFIKNRFNKVN